MDKYERECLRKKFSARLAAKPAKEGWQDIKTAPKNATEVILKVPCKGFPDFYQIIGHFAQDLSGSEQPSFSGWFRNSGYGFSQIEPEPTHWRALSTTGEPKP